MSSENKDIEVRKPKKNILKKQMGLIITVAIAFVALLIVYFTLIKPMTDDDDNTDEVTPGIDLIWEDEVEYTYNRIMVYEHIRSDNISKIEIHNPANKEKYGEQYVDWGIYRFKGEDPDGLLKDGSFYFTGYEFAPYDGAKLSALTNACGMAIASSRIEDHCTDFSKYGLDYASDEEAVYYVITKTDGVSYKVYIGDALPSGSGYYIRVVGNDKCLEEGKGEMARDSVYVSSNGYLGSSVLASPQDHITPYITYPVDPSVSSTFDYFMYIDHKTDTTISFIPITSEKDPFAVFSGLSIYYTVSPKGYYSSTSFEDVMQSFESMQGSQVLELATLMVSEEDNEEYYGFSDEIYEKYHITDDEGAYTVSFRHAGIENTFIVSALQEESYYYVYSMVMNTIVKVDYETLYFLTWEPETFISREVVNIKIDNCESISISGTYKDLGIEYPDREGVQNVNETFQLDGTVKGLSVTALSNGKVLDTANFRQLFRLLLQMYLRDELSEEEVKEALEGDPMATIQFVTRERTVYKTDDEGKETSEIDYTVASVTRIYRFYRLTNGRCVVTTESVDENGKSTGELGSFYMMSARVDHILSSVLNVLEGKSVNGTDRY